MEKNKSIDGLVSRRPKKTAKKTAPKKTTITKKQISQNKKPKTTIKVEEPNTTEKPKSTPKPTPKSTTEEFLEPIKAFDLDLKNSTKKTKKPSNQKHKPKKEKKKSGKVRKIISTIALIIVLALIGLVVWGIFWGNDIIAKITGGKGNIFDLLTFVDETYEPLQTDQRGRTNILAFGTSGYNMSGNVGKGTHDGAALTDSIMAISLNQETGDIAMISLPRDLKASPTCTATGKINEVYWCNNRKGDNEEAGAEALMTEVGSILGLDFQYYAHVNWSSVVQIVDTLEGITITLDEGIYDRYWTGAVFQPGVEYTINGEQALGLARARHGTSHGDFSRGASQQKILIGIKNRLMEKKLNIPEYLSLVSTLGDNLRTNFSVENLKTLAKLSFDFDLNSIRQISLIDPRPLMTTSNINGISYVIPSAGVGNYGNIRSYVAKMTESDPRSYENPSILILNGTEETGIASSEKSILENEGYSNISIDNAPEGKYHKKYTIYSLTNKPGTKLMLEKYYNTTSEPIETLPEGIPTDYDFVIVLGASE